MAIRAATKWFATAVAAVVLIPVIGDFFVELARQNGLYDDPEGAMSAFVVFIIGLANLWWYPWLACGLIGFGIGVWLDSAMKRVDSRRPGKAEAFADLHWKFESIIKRIRDAKPAYHVQPMRLSSDLLFEIRSFHMTLQKLGLAVPSDLTDDHMKFAAAELRYLIPLAPMSRDGHYREAKEVAREMCNEINLFLAGKHPQQRDIEEGMRLGSRPG